MHDNVMLYTDKNNIARVSIPTIIGMLSLPLDRLFDLRGFLFMNKIHYIDNVNDIIQSVESILSKCNLIYKDNIGSLYKAVIINPDKPVINIPKWYSPMVIGTDGINIKSFTERIGVQYIRLIHEVEYSMYDIKIDDDILIIK